MGRDRKDAKELILSSGIIAAYIIENCSQEEAHFLGDFFLNLGSNLAFLCRYPPHERTLGKGGKGDPDGSDDE